MDTLGVIPDIPVFEGNRVPVSHNALTLGTRPLQLLSLLGFDFPVRHNTDAMRGFQSEDPPMRSRVVAAGFGNYALGLRWTQPRFPPAMCYALMERWNDCTHSFIFGFGEMTLTLADFTAITGLGFDGVAIPLDARYQTAALGAELVGTLLGVTTRTRYTAQGYVSYEVVYKFWVVQSRMRLAAWKELAVDARPAAPAYTREERDQAALTYDWASLALAHLYHGLDVWTKGSGESNWQFLRPLEVWAYEYRIYPSGPEGDTSAEARRIPRHLEHRHHTYSSSEDPHYWTCYLNDRALADLFLTLWEGDAWATYRPRALAEALTRSRVLLQGVWVDRYFLGERVLEIRVATVQRRVPAAPPCHMCILEGMTPEDRLLEYDGFPADDCLILGDYASYLTTRLQARLPEVREYSQNRRRHRTHAFYRAQAEADVPAEPVGAVLGDVPFPPGMEVALDPTLGLKPALAIPADLRQAPPQLQLDPKHATHVPAQRYQDLYQRFCFARSYIARLYLERYDMELDIGMLRRHQSCQAAAVSRLQMEVDRLRTRLEVEEIPLDFSEEEDDDEDGSSSDDAPTPPPSSVRQAVASPAGGDELDIGMLRRHQSCQAAAVSRLQMEVDRLRTRLEVEEIPLDFSEEEDDDEDGSSSDDAPTPPPSSVRQAVASPAGGDVSWSSLFDRTFL
ncbi:hypothetical protein JCGZ_14771 [Jatropha curcas]|uniref:Aminotransferase-like plant mobile domain-containing protein n=1 Tax=Jatropha curcas TaxID=180498 RepID=A0A067K8T7_JATCU|nr:hypothetical protein JCGZ_14771 [Jatropha curcas]